MSCWESPRSRYVIRAGGRGLLIVQSRRVLEQVAVYLDMSDETDGDDEQDQCAAVIQMQYR